MADGKIRIDTVLETKSAAKSFQDLINMAKRANQKLEGAMKPGNSTKKLEEDLKAQEKIIQSSQKEIQKYQEQLDNIDSSKAVTALQKKIDKETQAITEGKEMLAEYENQLDSLTAKLETMRSDALKKVSEEYSPDTLKANPKLASYEQEKHLSNNVDYQDTIAQQEKLISQMGTYDKKIEQAESSVKDLKIELSSVKSEQETIAKGKIGHFSKALESAKEKASGLASKLQKVKLKADSSKEMNKSSNAMKSASSSAKSLGSNIAKSADSGMKKLVKLGLAIFSIRSAYVFARKAASDYLATNEEMSNQVAGMWNVIAQAVGPAVNLIIGWLSTLISYVNVFIKSLTGVDLVAKANSTALKKQASATKEVAQETKKASHEISGFDELHVADKNTGDSGGGTGGASAPIFTADAVDLTGISAEFEKLFEPLKNAWANYGQGFVDSFKYGLNQIWELTKSIGASFKEVWLNGTGQLTCELILQILTNIFNTIGNIAKNFREAWDDAGTGTAIIQNLWDIVNILLGGVNDITKSIEAWSSKLDFKPLLKSIMDVTAALKPFAKLISDNIKWAFDEVLLPLGKWVIEDAVPAAISAVSGALEVLSKICKSASDTFHTIWDVFFKPIADWTGGIIVDVMNGIGDALKAVAENEVGVSILEALGIVLGVITAGVTAWTIGATAASIATTAFGIAMAILTSPITLIIAAITAIIAIIILLVKHWDDVKAAAGKCWDWICAKWEVAGEFFAGIWQAICDVFGGIGNWFKDKFNEAYEGIKNIFLGIGKWFKARYDDIMNVFTSVGTWFKDKFVQAFNGIKSAFANIGKFFGDVWNSITSVFGNVVNWFKDKFSAAWQAVKNVFSAGGKIFNGIKDGILNGLKAVINALIDGINTVISIPFDGINFALKKIHDISILGKHPFGWLGTISVPQIPKLAKGGIVNNPGPGVNMGSYLAGERGPEAVIPLTDSQFVKDFAMMIAGNMKDGQTSKIIELLIALIRTVEDKELQIGDRDIGEANNRYAKRKGFAFSDIR